MIAALHAPVAVATTAQVRLRVGALTAYYEQVRVQRMDGVALLNPALLVQAVGFALAPQDDGDDDASHGAPPNPVIEGVLITPWFMSLVRLPLRPLAPRGIGQRESHRFGAMDFEFLGAGEMPLGYHQTCALFSPMFEFADQDLAVATAQSALDLARRGDTDTTPQPPASPSPTPAPAAGLSRRALLRGTRTEPR